MNREVVGQNGYRVKKIERKKKGSWPEKGEEAIAITMKGQ
jgi:hypothetical protein